MIVWKVSYDFCGDNNAKTIGIYSNCALAACAAMRFIDTEINYDFPNEYGRMIKCCERAWGYELFYEICYDCDDLVITIEQITINRFV